MAKKNLPKKILITSVGTICTPVTETIKEVSADYVIFICVDGAEGTINQVIGEDTPCQIRAGFNSDEKLPNIPTQVNLGSNFKIKTINNPDDMMECYRISIESILLAKDLNSNAEIFAGCTSGTKEMSMGLAIAASDYNIKIVTVSHIKKSRNIISGERFKLERAISEKSIKNKIATTKKGQSINNLKIGNFKAFSDLQSIPLRPITLIYGANSSGKSSILHSLLLAHHAMTEEGDFDVHQTKVGGDSVDLGGFGQYVYKRDRTSQVQWAVDLDPQKLNFSDIELTELMSNIRQITVRIGIGIPPQITEKITKFEKVTIRAFTLEADQETVLSMTFRHQGNLQLDSLNLEHPIIKQLITTIIKLELFSVSTSEEIKVILNEIVPNITSQIDSFFPQYLKIESENLEYYSNKIEYPLDDPQWDILLSDIKKFFLYHLNQLLQGIINEIETEIKTFRYLGPFRTYPPRHFAFSRQQDDNWNSGGGFAWDILLKDSEVRRKVNLWLGDEERMKSPYEIAVRSLLPTMELEKELPSIVNKELHDFLAFLIMGLNSTSYTSTLAEVQRIADIIQSSTLDFEKPDAILPDIQEIIDTTSDINTAIETWIDKLNDRIGDKVSDLVLIDKRSDTVVSHRDVGIGISQVIPILVSSYGLSDSLVAIEQPEIHLHPKLQAELGDVFIESALGQQQNRFILETHSEHLLLRIMRRMRETYYEELPEGISPVTPDDISVIFVDPDPEGSIVLEMPLNRKGELKKSWPGGFFEEGLEEVFA
ncbi:AAA family ATPase [Synechocystis sp. LEGE 06083]|uniref:AAA family ATPase n=1 Tax=Synechocystis sp. LEGE 06083 TaxID=915336 RepID=UPI001882A701|nr:AAA family ATPase [Synechocystis sp. LEGE 06083]MBE9194786.1 AAA family ATPase [Synechocystis sp. LEGE 06083]